MPGLKRLPHPSWLFGSSSPLALGDVGFVIFAQTASPYLKHMARDAYFSPIPDQRSESGLFLFPMRFTASLTGIIALMASIRPICAGPPKPSGAQDKDE